MKTRNRLNTVKALFLKLTSFHQKFLFFKPFVTYSGRLTRKFIVLIKILVLVSLGVSRSE